MSEIKISISIKLEQFPNSETPATLLKVDAERDELTPISEAAGIAGTAE